MIVNRIHIILASFLLIFSVSCQDLKKSERPEDLISESKMIDVLTEISLLHAARNYNKQKLENTGVNIDSYIYEKFDIDSLQLERSNDWYAEQYTQYERIYDSVKARVQVMKNRLDSIREIEVKKEDSIKKAKKDSLAILNSLQGNTKNIDSLKLESLKQTEIEEVLREGKDSLIESPGVLKVES
ncbi:DUF4296 domain-containing protein [Christiangramia sp.]|uniref:DUF4296 domain-containing protein n=1 Tax=Christiangramia sp. TaxID=1931228 RepID=UPI002606BFDA|nr:DUF4296 domain-containing protein [Christiangramia sp.]